MSLLLLLPMKLSRLPNESSGFGRRSEGDEIGDLARVEVGDGARCVVCVPLDLWGDFTGDRSVELNGDLAGV